MIIFGSPRRYLQGPNAIARLGEEIARVGKSAVLIADAHVLGLVSASAKESCRAAGIVLSEITFSGEITHAEVDRMVSLCTTAPPEVVVAAGGGKTIDAAKFFSGKIGAKLVTLPTVASNDSPTSHIIVVYDESHKLVGVEKLKANPDLVLVDTAIIAKAPAILLSAGIGDAIVKRFEVEQCVAANGNNVFGSRSPRTALALAHACYATVRADAVAALAAVKRGEPDEALERLVEATVLMSGLAFESGGLSVCHAMTRGLSAVPGTASALHGHQVAYGLLVQLVLEGRDTAFVEEIRGFFTQVALPLCLADLGFTGGPKEIAIIADLTAQAAHMKHFSRPVSAQDLVQAIEKVEAMTSRRKDAAE